MYLFHHTSRFSQDKSKRLVKEIGEHRFSYSSDSSYFGSDVNCGNQN